MMHVLSKTNNTKGTKSMKEAQLKKVGALLDLINEVVNDPEIPINAVVLKRSNGDTDCLCGGKGSVKSSKPAKKEYSEEELKERAIEHARLSNQIESFRIAELTENNKMYVTTTHLASAIKKSKYEVVNHLKNLVKEGKLEYVVKSFSIKDNDPEYKKNVKLIDFDKLAEIESALPDNVALFKNENVKDIAAVIKNNINGSEDMVAPM